jgi:hypothetical protein
MNARADARGASLDQSRKRRRAPDDNDDARNHQNGRVGRIGRPAYTDIVTELEESYDIPDGKTAEVFWNETSERIVLETRKMMLMHNRHDTAGAKDAILDELLPDMPPFMKAAVATRQDIMAKTKDWRSKLIDRITVSYLLFYYLERHI